MPIIKIKTIIKAKKQIVFDLSRSIDLHKTSTKQTKEEAIESRTSGLIKLNESVTWKAKHFGFTQVLTTKITAFDSPNYFTDEMTGGIFNYFKHEHHFSNHKEGTTMTDLFDYKSPFGLLEVIADKLFLEKYMENFLIKRNNVLKEFAESEQWRTILKDKL